MDYVSSSFKHPDYVSRHSYLRIVATYAHNHSFLVPSHNSSSDVNGG